MPSVQSTGVACVSTMAAAKKKAGGGKPQSRAKKQPEPEVQTQPDQPEVQQEPEPEVQQEPEPEARNKMPSIFREKVAGMAWVRMGTPIPGPKNTMFEKGQDYLVPDETAGRWVSRQLAQYSPDEESIEADRGALAKVKADQDKTIADLMLKLQQKDMEVTELKGKLAEITAAAGVLNQSVEGGEAAE